MIYSNGMVAVFFSLPNAVNHNVEVMQQTILFKVPGRPSTSPLVILTGPAIGAQYSIPVRVRLSRALSMAWRWTRCNCTPRRIVNTLFSLKVSTVVAIICLCVMWWHSITITNTLAAQEAVALDCLYAMPWALVWAIRATRMPMPEKGGEL